MRIEGHTFLVTGGASGLGAACVRSLLNRGARVLIADVASTNLPAHSSARYLRTDVTSAESVSDAVRSAEELAAGRGLRGVVQCAGIAPAERIVGREGEPHTLGVFEKVIAVNLVGTFNVMRLAAAAMAKNGPLNDGERGVIINTASAAAFEGQIGQAAYSASKGGVASMTLPAARELARHGIRVVAIAPGLFQTPMLSAMPEKIQQSLAASIPFPARLGQPEEFAALTEHIIENPMLNGATIRLDGAMRLAAK